MGPTYELTDGRQLPVVAEHQGHDYTAYVLYDVEAAHEWVLTWTDGINHWLEAWDYPWHAYARLAALVAACEQQVFLVHEPAPNEVGSRAFVEEAERLVRRTVHAFNCPPNCDASGTGASYANHGD